MVAFNWNVRLTIDRGIARLGCEGPESLKDFLDGATEQYDRAFYYHVFA